MTMLKKSLLALSMSLAAGFAAATPFSISTVTFVPGAGYGIEAETSGNSTLLDVRFSNAAFVAQTFNLDNVGESRSFAIGTINFAESNNAQAITAAERDMLDVRVNFTFTLPGTNTPFVFTTGTAAGGSIQDTAVDYSLNWLPVTVNFGTTGQYSIGLSNLEFRNNGTQTQNATITLLAADAAVAAVPEPGSIALFGLGMLALGGLRRRQRQA